MTQTPETEPFRFPVSEHARPESAGLDTDGLRNVILTELNKMLHSKYSIEDLLATEVTATNRAGRPVGVRPEYELRERCIGWAEDGIVGLLSTNAFRGIFISTITEVEAMLKREQPNCDWKLVAATIEQRWVNKSAPVRGDGGTGGFTLPTIDNPQPMKNTTGSALKHAKRPQYKWFVHLAYADIAQAELIDPTARHKGGIASNMQTYIDEREIRKMPAGMRTQREKATRIMLEFEELQKSYREEQLNRRALTVEQVEQAISMRQAGISFQQIAQLLQIKIDVLTREVDIHLAAQDEAAAERLASLTVNVEHVDREGNPAPPQDFPGDDFEEAL